MSKRLMIVVLLGLTACATPQQERGATKGAVIGATTGAIIGSKSDRTAEGAVVGGIIGGLLGAVLSDDRDRRVHRGDRRYHRRSCRRGEHYFHKAHRARHLDVKIQLMREGLRYCRNNPAAHNDLGVALMLRGNHRAAERHFNIALKLDPGYVPARRNLAYLHRHWRHGHKKRMKPYRKYRERPDHDRRHKGKYYEDDDYYKATGKHRPYKKRHSDRRYKKHAPDKRHGGYGKDNDYYRATGRHRPGPPRKHPDDRHDEDRGGKDDRHKEKKDKHKDDKKHREHDKD